MISYCFELGDYMKREKGDNGDTFVDSKKTMSKREFEEQEKIKIDILDDSNSELIILPENRIFGEPSEEENRFLPTTKEILTILSENGVDTSLYDDGRKRTEILLHAAPVEVVLPNLYFLEEPIKALIYTIVGAWIFEKFIKPYMEKPDMEQDEYNITVNLIQPKEDDNVDIRQLKGSPEELYEFLEKERKSSEKMSLINPVKPMPPYTEGRIQKAKFLFSKAGKQANEGFRKILEEDQNGAEELFKSALISLRQAYLHDNEDKYKKELFKIGRFVHDQFGCELKVSNEGMCDIDCPVLLADYRRGFSIGATGTGICSICGKDIFECPHLPSRTYNQVICTKDDKCNICREENCDHEVGKNYDNVKAIGIITKMNGNHVAFVENPLDPSCALINIPKPVDELLRDVPIAERGKLYNPKSNLLKCHYCVHPI